MPKDFKELFQQLPEEQTRLLDRMIHLGLVQSFGHNERGWAVIYTPKGKQLLQTLREISSDEPDNHLARIVALDMLAHSEGAFGGFAHE